MTDRDKVIKGLATCGGDDPDCQNCPYYGEHGNGFGCETIMQRDALSLLKAQQPRVMTLHDWEANHATKIPVWVEWSESARGECADYERADGWAVLNVDEFVDVLCFGGRCWTSRPTDEQRKAVKWDE